MDTNPPQNCPYLRHITTCNRRDNLPLTPLFAGDKCIGLPHPNVQKSLSDLPQYFAKTKAGWRFTESCYSVTQRTTALQALTATLITAGLLPALRHEAYPVVTEWGTAELARIDRAAVVPLGVPAFGVHVNGYVRRGNDIYMWIGRRARDRVVAPGKLDNMVAGGQPAGISLIDNVIKEAREEASLPAHIARRAVAASMLRYGFAQTEGPATGTKFDTLFCYDLELPEDIEPTPGDEECEGFSLLPIKQVLQIIAETDDFKFNVPLVILDFAIRRGILTADATPGYAALAAGLCSPLPHQQIRE